MDITKLKSDLQSAIPEELYQLKPNKVFLFIPREGVSVFDMLKESDSLLMIFPDIEIKLNFFPTDNEALIGGYAIKIPQETGTPDKIVIGSKDSLPGFARVAFGGDAAEDEETPSPIIISLDPKDRQVRGFCSSCPFNSEDNGFADEVLQVKPEKGSPAEKKLIVKAEKKLEKLLKDCAVLDIDIDVDKVVNKVKADLNTNIDYQLIIKGDRNLHNTRGIEYKSYDIYVADGEEYKLNLTGIEKAVYLTFLLFKDGVRIVETTEQFRQICMIIYGALPFKDKCEKDEGGLRKDAFFVPEVYLTTLRGYLSTIRDEVADKVVNPITAIEFAIEGYKDAEYGIKRSTKEIRNQIRKDFEL